MAKIITIAHQKGGVGKSTLALNLALCFQGNLSVSIVDTDLQGSLFHIRDDFPGLPVLMPSKVEYLQELEEDLVIVDTPPYLSDQLPELFFHSDFILIPTKAGFFDVMAIRTTLAMVRQVQARTFNIGCGVVLNMVKPRSGITKETLGLLEVMEAPILNTRIHDRVSIARSSMTGGILNGGDQKAIGEITSLAEEIVNLISG